MAEIIAECVSHGSSAVGITLRQNMAIAGTTIPRNGIKKNSTIASLQRQNNNIH